MTTVKPEHSKDMDKWFKKYTMYDESQSATASDSTTPLLCSGLGKRQKEAIKHLLDGKHISVMQDLSRMTQEQHITDDDKSDWIEISEPVIRSLVNRNLLSIKRVYSTVQPDTEHYEIRLKSEMVEVARKACT